MSARLPPRGGSWLVTSGVGFLAVLAVWQLVCLITVAGKPLVNPLFLATPGETAMAVKAWAASGDLLWDATDSLRRVVYGLALAMAIGLPLGVIFGLSEGAQRSTRGVMDFLRSIPPIVVYPVSQLILGPFDASRVGVVVFGATTVIVLATSEGVRNCSKVRQRCNRLLGATWRHVVTSIVLLESLPAIVVGIRTAVSLSVIIVVVTEMLVGAKYGLGVRAAAAQSTSATPTLYAVILVVGIIGLGLNVLLVRLERLIGRWKFAC